MIFRNYKKDTKEVPWSDAFWTVIKNFWANSRRNQPLKLLCFYCRTAKISFCWQICFINISLIKPTGHPFKIDLVKPTRCPYFCDSEQAWSGLKEKNVRFQFMAVKNRKPLKFPKATIPTLRFSQTLSLPFIPKISKKSTIHILRNVFQPPTCFAVRTYFMCNNTKAFNFPNHQATWKWGKVMVLAHPSRDTCHR